MEVIERYEPGCSKDFIKAGDKCYNPVNISKADQCEKGFVFDKMTAKCLSNSPNDIVNFYKPKDNKCGTDGTLIYNNINRTIMCAPNKYIKEAKCDIKFQQIGDNICYNPINMSNISSPDQCDKGFAIDKMTGKCLSNHPNDIVNFYKPKDNKCGLSGTLVYTNNGKDVMCSPNKYLIQPKKNLSTNMTLNQITKPDPVQCASGDKLIDNECVTAPIPITCPPNPFGGKSLVYDSNKGVCK